MHQWHPLHFAGQGFLEVNGSYKWVISRVTIVITQIRGLITPLITTPKPEILKTPIEPFKGTLKGTP